MKDKKRAKIKQTEDDKKNEEIAKILGFEKRKYQQDYIFHSEESEGWFTPAKYVWLVGPKPQKKHQIL